MVEINMVYKGELRCEAVHAPSGSVLATDAPKDNMGKGEAFSPTDLVATALGTCILTTMAIVAGRIGADITGATAKVHKEMQIKPSRMLGKISVDITFVLPLSDEHKKQLEHAAFHCPVHKSMHPDVVMPISFNYS